MRVRVVGAGIVGLAAALGLREAGHDVDVVGWRLGEETTSAVAAALWYPYLALPEREVTRWAAAGYARLCELATDPPTGVDLRDGRQLFRHPTPDPWWAAAGPSIRRVPGAELPDGYRDGIELRSPVVDMPVHLRWLRGRLAGSGVPVTRRRLTSLQIAQAGVDVVVNCAGLGARELAGDDELRPVRGQVLLVEQVGLSDWTLDETDAELTYVVPRRGSVVLGGTAEEGDEDLRPRPATARAIRERAAALVPLLRTARTVSHRVGLRPARPAVRLERDGDVVHCYGHGGAGVTLAYGCAKDVVDLLTDW